MGTRVSKIQPLFDELYLKTQLLLLYLRPAPPPQFCLYKCKDLEFRVCSKLFAGMIAEKENVRIIPDGIMNAGLSLLYIGVQSVGLSNIGL